MWIRCQIMRRFKLTFLVFFVLVAGVAAAAVDYYSPENVLQFADFLFEEGDYLRAAGEYQRYLYYARLETAPTGEGARLETAPTGEGTRLETTPTGEGARLDGASIGEGARLETAPTAESQSMLPNEREAIHYKIALCYRFGGKPARAIDTFETLLQKHPQSAFASRAYYQIGVSYFLMEQFADAAQFLQETLPRITDTRQHTESEQLIGLAYLMQKQWRDAEEVFKTLQTSEVAIVRDKAATYHHYAVQGANLPNRNSFVAGLLSTMLPGAGRLYTGRTGDAIASLIVVGLTAWQAYDGFNRDGITSVKGWTFGTIGGAFYLGNIYGSVISARVYNRTVENEFLSTLSIELPF